MPTSPSTPAPRGLAHARRRLAVVLAALVLALTVLPTAPAKAFLADGPIFEMVTTLSLGCEVRHEAGDSPNDPFPTSRVDQCGTMIAFDGGQLYHPQQMTPGGTADDHEAWSNVSGAGFGTGTVEDPRRSVTRVTTYTGEEVSVEETNAYVDGDDAYLNTVEIINDGPAPVTGVLYRRVDCNTFLQSFEDGGTEATYDAVQIQAGGDGSVDCVFTLDGAPTGAAAPRVALTPVTGGSSHLGDDFGDDNLYEDREAQGVEYGDTCVCDTDLDIMGRIGVSWTFTVPAGGTATYESALAFSPRGGAIDRLPSLVDAPQPPPPTGGDPDGITRLSGASRFETAVAISAATYGPDGRTPGAVVLARADNFADALSGAPFANAQDAPLLLTSTDSLHPATAAELDRLLGGSGTVFLLGGTAAIDDGVAGTLAGLGYTVDRISGPTRYATSVAIAGRTTSAPREVWFADGNTFGNAIAAGATAAGRTDAVLLLLNNATPTAEVDTYMADNDVPGGGQFSVGPISETSPDIAVGVTQTYDEGSASANAAALAADPAIFDASQVLGVAVANVERFPDGLAGGANAGLQGIPLVLTPDSGLDQATQDALEALGPLQEAVLYGGTAVIDEAVAAQVALFLR